MPRLTLALFALSCACDSPEPTPPDWATSSESGTSSDAGESSGSNSSGDGTSSESGAPAWDLTLCDDVRACVAAHTQHGSDGFLEFDDSIWDCFPTVDPDQPERVPTCECVDGLFGGAPTFCGSEY